MLVVRCNKLPFEKIGGELVILDAESDVFFSSNIVGMTIWENMESPVLVSDLCAIIFNTFEGIQYEAVVLDTGEFIDSLLKKNLAIELK